MVQTGGSVLSDAGPIGISAGTFAQGGGGTIITPANVSITSQGSANFADSLVQGDNVLITAANSSPGSFAQSGNTDLIAASNQLTIEVGPSGTLSAALLQQSAGDTLSGQAVSLFSSGPIDLAGTVQAGVLSGGIYTGALSIVSTAAGITRRYRHAADRNAQRDCGQWRHRPEQSYQPDRPDRR